MSDSTFADVKGLLIGSMFRQFTRDPLETDAVKMGMGKLKSEQLIENRKAIREAGKEYRAERKRLIEDEGEDANGEAVTSLKEQHDTFVKQMNELNASF